VALAVLAVATSGCARTSSSAPAVSSAAAPGTASPAAPALPAVRAASRPLRVQIPVIGVDSELMDLGLQDDGTLEVPATGSRPAGSPGLRLRVSAVRR
jgi:hypothetical protein